MRLYLSSYHLGNQTAVLRSWLPVGARAAIVMNACDVFGDENRPSYVRAEVDALASIGIVGEELDLRDYFGKQNSLEAKLKGYDFVWVVGGNVFVLRRAMHMSGFDNIIGQLLARNEIVYGGFSAGAVVMGPTLRGFETMDDPKEVPTGYDEHILWDGLGVIRDTVIPHVASDHRESIAAGVTVQYFEQRELPYRALADGEVFIVEA